MNEPSHLSYNGRVQEHPARVHARFGARGDAMRLGTRQTRYEPARRDCGRSLIERKRLEGPAGDIMAAARALFERQGVRSTTVKDIAAEAGVTRELVYYYFENKQAVIDAVLDDYVEDLVESVVVWNESRAFGDTSGSLKTCIAAFRRALYDAEGNQRPMIRVLEELGVRDSFDVRAVRETVDCIHDHIVTEYAEYHQIEIDLVYEMFCVVIFGLVGLVKINPEISDEALMKVVEQALRLDMVPLAVS
nr:TetR/AcrR family transcriptional regulator [Paraeggerthella hongkongensis]